MCVWGAGEGGGVQWVKPLATKSDDPSLTSRNHMVEGENRFQQVNL